MQEKSRKYKEFTIFFKNDFETDFLITEIFEEACYQFKADNIAPFIIDCGAHIGISVLYFKHIYPASKIIAFEPDKNSFELLKKNIAINNLNDVTIHNSAIADFDGEAIMYGDFTQGSESVGNTLIKNWGDRSGFTTSITSVVDISETIKKEFVDYLKIDTEGTELTILKKIEQYLSQVKNIYVEFHEYDDNKYELLEISKILERNYFQISTNSLDLTNILSEKYPLWVKNHKPSVHTIKGIKNEIRT
jgi:FkbM family methyltransferase